MTSLNTTGRSLLRSDAGLLATSPLTSVRWLRKARNLQPGLTLSWALMAVVILWALFPQWFTSHSGNRAHRITTAIRAQDRVRPG